MKHTFNVVSLRQIITIRFPGHSSDGVVAGIVVLGRYVVLCVVVVIIWVVSVVGMIIGIAVDGEPSWVVCVGGKVFGISVVGE